MKFYINSIVTDRTLRMDIKELIPDMTLRRRMSRVVKMGVMTAMESLSYFDAGVDAIITATALGCLADSEKFLDNLIGNREQMLNPTPFIQSTFNIVGAQVALLTGSKGYNMTYAHGALSFESALMDGIMRLEEGVSKAVLVGAVDESTPTQRRIMERMGFGRNHCSENGQILSVNEYRSDETDAGMSVSADSGVGEGAVFFVLTVEPTPRSVGVVEKIDFHPIAELSDEKVRKIYGNGVMIVSEGGYHTAVIDSFVRATEMVTAGESTKVAVVNRFAGKNRSVIVIGMNKE